MIVVDSSVWIGQLRQADSDEVDKLETVDKDHGSLHLLRYALHGGS
jgi:hypothetical protein